MQSAPIVRIEHLSRSFIGPDGKSFFALNDVSLTAQKNEITMLVGPDGAGKTTLLRICAGLLGFTSPKEAANKVLDLDLNTPGNLAQVQQQISYMPQRFGLYEDLSVMENMELYARLYGLNKEEFSNRAKELLHMTNLTNFTTYLAGTLSGGMKQKLGLACTLLSHPKLLILDEPCVGVDPLSRVELWEIIRRNVKQDKLSVLISTSYLDETQYANKVYVLNEGMVIFADSSKALEDMASNKTYAISTGLPVLPRVLGAMLLEKDNLVVDAVPNKGSLAVTLGKDVQIDKLNLGQDYKVSPRVQRSEDGFMCVFNKISQNKGNSDSGTSNKSIMSIFSAEELLNLSQGKLTNDAFCDDIKRESIIEVKDLVKNFGNFTAVNHTSFNVEKGEIFGLLGPNGAGKTTTFRMLCGLIPASSGILNVAGFNLRKARVEARKKIGYVAQKFSLYTDLSVGENLDFFAGVYGLRADIKTKRINEVIEQYELMPYYNTKTLLLPGGFKQRLSMAVGTIHKPEILFLDEPTSGIDPIARRIFWHQITGLAKEGTTVIITTHFLEEAEYCNRIMIQDKGEMIALGTPDEVRKQGMTAGNTSEYLSMEEVFISIVKKFRDKEQ